jgi:murein endopeptidase
MSPACDGAGYYLIWHYKCEKCGQRRSFPDMQKPRPACCRTIMPLVKSPMDDR